MGDGRFNRAIEQGRARGANALEQGRARGGELARHYAKLDVQWARTIYARAAREGILTFGLGPLMDVYMRRRALGQERFLNVEPPVIFVANHSSHLDTPTVLRSLPFAWRSRTAVAAAEDYFYKKRWKANGVALMFNTFPIGRKGGGLGDGATDHVDRLIEQRWNLMMFPEGTRSRDGRIGKVRSGAAVLAARHGISIVPIFVSGTHEAMPPGQDWPKRVPGRLFSRRHKVTVRFGDPIAPRSVEDRHEVMEQVRAFWERKGLPADPAAAGPPHNVLHIHGALMAHEAALARNGAHRFERDAERSGDRSPTAA